ncbi:hypothetical protein DUNSADRAFT_13788 [Dunaliella salina]|uniref:WDHD1/CFT4 second beta-propeller domain-containing protein n=1 Tax=Dunaliella salina TaxID=3046 RepID=A0ABQ7G8P2_DUNSA|nr:hypothetical protein DUNSADRAFT_13788 [Dunaliella salina]|eukprot:KAF5830978.1 hypothetical protein DUNSADRAFT_13788 [Dunaliella salina]
MGGAWLPVWSSATASKSGEVYWPVAIRSQELCSIMCPKHQPYPSVNPRPFFTRLPLQVPVLSVEGGAPALEAELMLTSLRIDSARLRSETAMGLDAVHAADELVGRQAEADRSLLKIFQVMRATTDFKAFVI